MSVTEKMTALANAVREKTGITEPMGIDAMTQAIKSISSVITDIAKGSKINLSYSAETKLLGLKIFGKTTQNGTPSPDAPVPLVSPGDGGSIAVSVAGKNLLNSTNFPWRTALPTKIDTQFLTCQLPAGEYVLSIKSNTGIMRINAIAVNLLDAENKTVKSINGGSQNSINGSSVFSLTEEEAAKGTKISFYYNYSGDSGYTTGEYVTELQIERGSSATAYEPYKEPQTLTLSTPNGLPGIPVSSGGNYTDDNGQQWICDEVDFGRGKYVQNVYYHTFDGTESDIGCTAGKNWYIKKPLATLAYGEGTVISSHYQAGTGTGGDNTGYLDRSGLVAFKDRSFTDIDAFKAYLAANPVTVCYPLATPIETDLTPEQLAAYAALHTNYPNTIIFNDGGADMEVKYVVDTKSYIDTQIATVAEAILNS